MASPVEVARLVATLEADITKFKKGMNQAESQLAGFDDSTKRSGRAAGAFGGAVGKMGAALGGALVVKQVVDFGKEAVDAFADSEEAVNAVNVVFGEAADTINDFADNAVSEVGLTGTAVRQMSTTIGSALQNAGFSADEAADKTVELTRRAGDMASVFNTDVDQALGAIQAALRGEIDPIERFGVGMSAATVEAKALSMGLAETKGEIDETDKATARLALIMEQTEKVAGDFADTSDSLANKSKIMAARMQEAREEIGEKLAPVALELMDVFLEMLPTITDLAESFASLVSEAAPFIEVIGDMLDAGLGELADIFGDVSDVLNDMPWSDAEDDGEDLLDSVNRLAAGFMDKLVPGWEDAIDWLIEYRHSVDESADATDDMVWSADELASASESLYQSANRSVEVIRELGMVAKRDTADGLRAAAAAQQAFNNELSSGHLDDASAMVGALQAIGFAADATVDSILTLKATLEGLNLDPRFTSIDLDEGTITTTSGQTIEGARAAGGPVTAGRNYLVGEQGPEMFVPNRSGTIVPNDQMGGMGEGVTINLNVTTTPGFSNEVIREMEMALQRYRAGVS